MHQNFKYVKCVPYNMYWHLSIPLGIVACLKCGQINIGKIYPGLFI